MIGCDRKEPIRYEVIPSHLNVRSDPTMTSLIRHIAKQGDLIIEFDKQGPWIGGYIVGSNVQGWLHSNYLKEIE